MHFINYYADDDLKGIQLNNEGADFINFEII